MSFRIDLFTIFPALVEVFAQTSLVGKATERGVLDIRVRDLRDHTTDVHRSVDDAPYGGGPGMVLRPEPIFAAVEQAEPPRPLLLLSPSGRPFDQKWAGELSRGAGLSLLCGRYEGVDHRVRTSLVDGEVSLGDFVLAGGEIAAMAVVEAVARLVPGVLGNAESVADESFTSGLLEYPQYTRPAEFRGMEVPAVLLSGDHARVTRWRRAQALRLTLDRRPDLIERRGGLTEADQRVLTEFDSHPDPDPVPDGEPGSELDSRPDSGGGSENGPL